MEDGKFYKIIEEIVKEQLKKEKLLNGNWHLGTVDSVIDSKKLKVLVDGGQLPQTISCNPDVTFSVGDSVWVIFINGNPRDKFVLSKRAV